MLLPFYQTYNHSFILTPFNFFLSLVHYTCIVSFSPHLSALQMSQIGEKSPKHCAQKRGFNLTRFNKKFLFYLSTLFLTLLSLILLVWFFLHPTKPQFSLKEAGVNQLNLSSPSLLNASIQLTLDCTNPNKKISIYYDEILLYVSYKSQKITPEVMFPPFYQDHEETTTLSQSFVGIEQPVSMSFMYEVQRDRNIGRLALNVKAMGQLRWKVGTWVSGKYRFVVNCITVMPFHNVPSLPLSSTQGSECSTTM